MTNRCPAALALALLTACMTSPDVAPEPPLPPLESCEASPHAPPPAPWRDGLAALADLHEVRATFVFDVTLRDARAVAEARFTTASTAAYPVLDLRQRLTSAELDGRPVTPAVHSFSQEPYSEVLVLPVALPACSPHVLRLAYRLGTPRAPGGRAPVWHPGGVGFDFAFTDLDPGRYLESWLPSGLVHDALALTLDVHVTGTAAPHTLITTGAVTPLAPNRWRVTFPPHTRPSDPFLALRPTHHLVTRTRTATHHSGTPLDLVHHRDQGTADPADPDRVLAWAAHWVTKLSRRFGDLPHPGPLVLFETPTTTVLGGMEHAGAFVLYKSAEYVVAHELAHQWLGRGWSPATAEDGWIDEAWTMFWLGELAPEGRPVALHRDPWARTTRRADVFAGLALFRALGAHLGDDRLAELLVDLLHDRLRDGRGSLLSTADLERHLHDATGDPEVPRLFAHWLRAGP